MPQKGDIKNVQARVPQGLYIQVEATIKDINDNRSSDQERVFLQGVIIEALGDWLRKHQKKDPFLDIGGIIDTQKIPKKSK
ncbi:MAG: hypothetical protein ACXAC7_04970 [Candidatus Hodarchaeales archaeon]